MQSKEMINTNLVEYKVNYSLAANAMMDDYKILLESHYGMQYRMISCFIRRLAIVKYKLVYFMRNLLRI